MTTPRFMGREPVLWLAAFNAVLAVLVGFGLDVTGEQQGLIHAAASAVFALIARGAVAPTNPEPAEDGAVTLVEVALIIAIVILVAWALGEVPR